MYRAMFRISAVLAALIGAQPAHADGKSVYESACAGCHASGVLGAPRLGNNDDWAPRVKGGVSALYRSALQGTTKGMPPKGGRVDLPDADIRAAVDYMLGRVTVARGVAKPRAEKPMGTAIPAADKAVPEPAPAPRRVAVAPTPPSGAAASAANAFNRLLRPPSERNPPPAEDGIHDPANDGTLALQSPREAFAALPKSNSGNRVDWVKALEQKRIAPRWDRADPAAEPTVFDLNIVREVKGSMPDVVYPHKQHTEWLDCSNCHPALFVPQKGANQISMAAILLGQKCGVCHGKVAFPVSECRLCHARKKSAPAQASAEGR